jgi:hypothetical protein
LIQLLRDRLSVGPDAVEQLCAGDERDAQAGGGQDQSGIAGIILQIMDAPFDGADRDRISYQKRLQARLDDKQATDLSKHLHCLIKRHANGAVPPFPD